MTPVIAVTTCYCKNPSKAILNLKEYSDISNAKMLIEMDYISMLKQRKNYIDNCGFHCFCTKMFPGLVFPTMKIFSDILVPILHYHIQPCGIIT